jgi:hypothetical protein
MLRNRRVQQFDLGELARQFDEQRDGWHNEKRWSIMHAALDAHLDGDDDNALGGDLAYGYGMLGKEFAPQQALVVASLNDLRFGNQSQSFTPVT